MRKLLLIIVALFIAAGITFAIISREPSEEPESPLDTSPSTYVKDIRFEMPEGMRLSYDVEITRRRSASSSSGRLEFESVSEMGQTLANIGKETDTTFKTFHMDVFRDLRVNIAKIGDQPMPSQHHDAMKDEDERIFKFGTYIFNANKMLNNGLPVETPKLEKDSDLVNIIVTYMQYFPPSIEPGSILKWKHSRKAGEYEINYEFLVTKMVKLKDHTCAVIEGTASLGSAKLPKDIQIQPSTFKFWLSTDKHVIIRSEIALEFRVEGSGIWTAIKMGMVKKLTKLEELNSVKLAQLRDHSQQIIDTERKARQEKRDMDQLPTWRAYLDNVTPLLGAEDPYLEGLTFMRETFIR